MIAAAMNPSLLVALALLGVASGVHCVGMCGGIVTAFSARAVHEIVPLGKSRSDWRRQLAFNLGRISSYALAGALAGALGSAGALVSGVLPVQTALLFVANVVVVLVGLQLAGWGAALSRLEALGAPLWRRLQPAAARLLGAQALPQVYAAGMLWGWLPCGLVYGALALALAATSSPLEGAAAMLAFGLGTLPNLLAAGLAASRVRGWLGQRAVRATAGAVVLGFGLYGVANAAGVAEAIRRGILCL